VLSTYSGSEWKIKRSLEELFGDRYDLYLPCRELFHAVNGDYRRVIRPLFPGYIFIYKEIEDLLLHIRNYRIGNRLHPVRHNYAPAMVGKDEMEFLMQMTGPDGLVKISEGIINENCTVEIISGPLKNLTGRILFINKRKKKAKIRINMLNREVQLTLGLDVLNHSGG
jgi:transcriptional antiterminator NusG